MDEVFAAEERTALSRERFQAIKLSFQPARPSDEANVQPQTPGK